ncbi:MAG: antibiotic biosynthesis monooxygenase [Betaproteobacteria bacterium]
MIARLWRGRASGAAEGYLRHFREQVRPVLERLAGHRGSQVLVRDGEILVLTFWDSMDAVRAFAGEEPERAVVEPEARAVLAEYDDFVRHYEVAR